MTSRSMGRHRAPSRDTAVPTQLAMPQMPRPHLSGAAGPVAKAGAVIAVSGGLVASLGLQANAATITTVPAASMSASSSSVATSTTASGAPRLGAVQLGAVQLGALQFGEIGFTAAVTPKPKPKATPRAKTTRARVAHTTRPFPQRSSRSTTRSAVSTTGEATTGEATTTEATTTEAADSVTSASSSVKAGAPGSGGFGASVLAIAARYAGIDYRYGGTTPAGFDCSGYTSYVLAQVGIDLPRTSGAQRAGSTRISRSEAVAGDLVFMPGHVGIYAGNGYMWDAPRAGKNVQLRRIYSTTFAVGRIA